VLGIAAALVALLLGLIVLFLIGIETGRSLFYRDALATIPVPIYVTLVLGLIGTNLSRSGAYGGFLLGAFVRSSLLSFLNTAGVMV